MTDTTAEAERILIDIYRRMSVSDKWRQLGELYRTARLLHEAGFRQRRPDATAQDVVHDWLELTLEPELLRQLRGDDRWINWLASNP
ncbi:MAG TPA: hypothetical protein VND64_14340 [Pirellulales bacterium]|nr:hypothetical protein [Pirellulales bacterium]